MVEGDAGSNGRDVLSLGVAALIGKAMNDKDILNDLVDAKNSKDPKEQLYQAAKKACIDLTDCDINDLLREVCGRLTIIDLIKSARDCVIKENPDCDTKWRD